MQLEAQSYGSRNQLAVSQKQIDAAMELEWDRRYITVLGVANRRLYEFRLQTANESYDQAKVTFLNLAFAATFGAVNVILKAMSPLQDTLLFIAHSFRCADVDN